MYIRRDRSSGHYPLLSEAVIMQHDIELHKWTNKGLNRIQNDVRSSQSWKQRILSPAKRWKIGHLCDCNIWSLIAVSILIKNDMLIALYS